VQLVVVVINQQLARRLILLLCICWCDAVEDSQVEGQEMMPQRVVVWLQKFPYKEAAGAKEAQLRLKAPSFPSMAFAFSPNPLEMVVWAKWASILCAAFPSYAIKTLRVAGHAQVLRNDHLHIPHMAPCTHIIIFFFKFFSCS